MKPLVTSFFDDATHTLTYLVADPASRAAVVIDPVLDYDPDAAQISHRSVDRVLDAASEQGVDVQWVLETHAHADHLSGAKIIADRIGAPIAIGGKIQEVQRQFGPLFGISRAETGPDAFDRLLEEGEELSLGELTIQVLHTPGHTPACVSYLIGDSVFVGDTLFMPDFGTARADFPGGDAATLYRSVQKLLALPPETRMFVGHDYLPDGRAEFAWETTVAEQRSSNVHVHEGVSEAEFVRLREARDEKLGVPQLILPSLQVNVRGGNLPEPDSDGVSYLRLPINQMAKA